MIPRELCKKVKFTYSDEWYVHKLESVLEIKTRIILGSFGIKTDHLIPTRLPDLLLLNKKEGTYHPVDFAIPAKNRKKIKESEELSKCLDFDKELKNS